MAYWSGVKSGRWALICGGREVAIARRHGGQWHWRCVETAEGHHLSPSVCGISNTLDAAMFAVRRARSRETIRDA